MYSILLFLSFAVLSTQAVQKLEHFNVDPNSVTVSGISSGGAMAMQFHFAHSSEVKGAGIFAGGPYLCAYNQGLIAMSKCMMAPGSVDVNSLVANTNKLATAGEIDPTSNINGSSVYIWHGKLDIVVQPAAGVKIAEMYQRFGAKVTTEFTKYATHGQPTDNFGGACGLPSISTYFINNCGYNGAYEMLNTLYNQTLTRPTNSLDHKGEIQIVNQNEFLREFLNGAMASEGYLYVPPGCKDGSNKCRFHIAFHGCLANKAWIKDSYITKTGYAQTADANNIIMLFPQVGAINPTGCWDWIGYSGKATYPTKNGPQIGAVYKMMERIVKA